MPGANQKHETVDNKRDHFRFEIYQDLVCHWRTDF